MPAAAALAPGTALARPAGGAETKRAWEAVIERTLAGAFICPSEAHRADYRLDNASTSSQYRRNTQQKSGARSSASGDNSTTTSTEIRRQLRRAAGLGALPEAAIRKLVLAGRVRMLRRGERLFSEGERGTHAFVVLSGTLAILRETESETLVPIALRSAGEWVGELAFLDGGARSATVLADSNATLFELPASAFDALLTTHPRVAIEIAGAIGRRLRESDTALIDLLRKQNASLARENRTLRSLVSEEARAEASDSSFFPGSSPAAAKIRHLVRRAARSDRAVLLLGEPGTPKASLAHAVHARSARAQELLVGVDCRSIEPDALEQELFGAAHAVGRVPVTGALATVERGTLVLSGVEALSPWLQGLLLHVLRRGEYARPGSARIRAADVRVLATSDADLDALVRSGQFRADLQSALRGFEISIPPLRQRRRDLRELVDAMCERDESSRLRLDRSAYEALSRCAFPRNDEELREVLADLAAFQQPGSTLSSREIAGLLASRESQWPDAYADALRAFRIQHLRQALERAGGNQAEAGRILGLHPSNLHRMLRVLGLGRERD